MCQKNGFPCQNSSSSPAYYISKPAYRVCVDRQLDRIVDFNACYTALCSITYTTGAGEAKPNFFLSKYPSVTKLYVFFHEVPHLHNILYIRARTTGITGIVTFGFFRRCFSHQHICVIFVPRSIAARPPHRPSSLTLTKKCAVIDTVFKNRYGLGSILFRTILV